MLALSYMIANVCIWISDKYFSMRLLQVVREHLLQSSLVFRRSAVGRPVTHVLLTGRTQQLCLIEPKLVVSVNDWKRCDTSHSTVGSQSDHNSVYLMCDLGESRESCGSSVEVDSLVQLVATKSRNVIAKCSQSHFDQLVHLFVDNVFMVYHGQPIECLTTVTLSTYVEPPSVSCGNAVSSHSGDVDELVPKSSDVSHSKPPNVLIYCGKKDSARLFEAVKQVFCQCLNTDCYTIYHLKHDHVLSTPWIDNTILLVIASDKVYDGVDSCFLKYFLNGGMVVNFGSPYDSLIIQHKVRTSSFSGLGVLSLKCGGYDDVAVICSHYCYDEQYETMSLKENMKLSCLGRDRQTGHPVILKAIHETSGGVAILSQVYLEKDSVELAISSDVFTLLKKSNYCRFDILRRLLLHLGLNCEKAKAPPLTPIYLMAQSQDIKSSFMKSVTQRLHDNRLTSRDLTLNFMSTLDDTSVTAANIPVIISSQQNSTFRFEIYQNFLKTKVLGNTILFADVITTTMNLFEGLMFSCPSDVGLIAIARQQVAGQGRGGNAWLSPDGCAMFSVHVRIPVISELGQRVTYLQHIMALAVVLAVRQKLGCETVDLRIKWPNDIYFGHDVKLGGIIVKSSIMQDIIHANIGCGVNVTNKDPTLCINDLVTRVAVSEPYLFSVEEIIARSVTVLEQLITDFQTKGQHAFLDRYYKYWLHSGRQIRLGSDDGVEGEIIGLDDYGFLLVKLADGNTVSVQPDGNSFDMMKNLILPKSS